MTRVSRRHEALTATQSRRILVRGSGRQGRGKSERNIGEQRHLNTRALYDTFWWPKGSADMTDRLLAPWGTRLLGLTKVTLSVEECRTQSDQEHQGRCFGFDKARGSLGRA